MSVGRTTIFCLKSRPSCYLVITGIISGDCFLSLYGGKIDVIFWTGC